MKFDDIKDLLPSMFAKAEESNLGKTFKIFLSEITNLTDLIAKMDEWKDIDNASGKVLDQLGENIGQNRGMANDEIYRVLIRGKFMRNTSDGSLNRIILALSSSLHCPPESICIINGFDSDDLNEPASLVIETIPLKHLNQTGLTIRQFIQIVNQIIPAGVRLSYINLEGTFGFSVSASIEASEDGFADIEGTTGGFLGGSFADPTEFDLPL